MNVGDAFTVVVGQGKGWLVDGAVWEIDDGGGLTRRPRFAVVDSWLVPFDGGFAMAHGRCTDEPVDAATDVSRTAGPDCPGVEYTLQLLDGDGAAVREVTLGHRERPPGDVQTYDPRIVGTSGSRVWVELGPGEILEVRASGEVETLPRPPFPPSGIGDRCVIDGELFAVEAAPEDDRGTGDGATPGTTIRIARFADGGWRSVPGAERTFEEASYQGCGPEGFVELDRTVVHTAARWTPDEGWVRGGQDQDPPPGSVTTDSELHLWGPDGEILRRRADGGFDRTGVVIRDPDGGDDAPARTTVSERDGTIAACAQFPVDGSPEPQGPPLACDVVMR